jgi:hypothetical protein
MNKLSDEKIKAIAAEYISNGFKKVEALLTCGYKRSYAESIGLKIYDNIRFNEIFSKMQAKQELKGDITIAYIQQEHERLAKIAEEKGDFSTATRNKELLGKTIAAYKDQSINTQPEQSPMSEDERLRLKRLSEIYLSEKAGTGAQSQG